MSAAADETDTGGRRRGPRLRTSVLGLLVLAGLAAGAVLLTRPDAEDAPDVPPGVEVAAVAESWLGSWEEGDARALRRRSIGAVRQIGETVDRFRADLGATTLRAVAGTPIVDPGAATASVPFQATVGLGGGRSWSYDGSLPVARTGEGDWRVRWSAAALHPQLADGTRIVRSESFGPRARILDTTGAPLTVSPSLRSVASGLRATFEHRLAGEPTIQLRVSGGPRDGTQLASLPGRPAGDLRTTIDPRIQVAAEGALTSGVPNPKASAQPAALVVVRPSTGSVLAVASRPANGFDRALQGRYPPGSTAKIVTTMALLQHGVTAGTPTTCPKEALVGGRKFVNAEGDALGAIDFGRAFANSCNTAFVQVTSKLAPADLVQVADAVGFNRAPQLGMPVAASSYPVPGSAADQAAMAIGQGRILVTPLQMASVAATAASGAYRRPRIVDDGPPAGARPLPPEVTGTLRVLMRRVVTEGTAKEVGLPGNVHGKTGTAEFGTASPPRTHLWFVGFRDDLAFAVVVEDAEGFGSTVSAPIAADFLRRLG